MSKIENEADVRAWAVAVVEAKGEKFTALSKGEQFAIAKYIVETSQTGLPDEAKPDNVAIAEAAESLPKAEETETQPLPQGLIPPLSLPESSTPNPVQGDSVSAPVEPPTSKAIMTRAYAYHRAGFGVQQTYDKFLEWCNDHPKEKEVMDFSTGQKSIAAAFAYWLGENITVDVPSPTFCY